MLKRKQAIGQRGSQACVLRRRLTGRLGLRHRFKVAVNRVIQAFQRTADFDDHAFDAALIFNERGAAFRRRRYQPVGIAHQQQQNHRQPARHIEKSSA